MRSPVVVVLVVVIVLILLGVIVASGDFSKSSSLELDAPLMPYNIGGATFRISLPFRDL